MLNSNCLPAWFIKNVYQWPKYTYYILLIEFIWLFSELYLNKVMMMSMSSSEKPLHLTIKICVCLLYLAPIDWGSWWWNVLRNPTETFESSLLQKKPWFLNTHTYKGSETSCLFSIREANKWAEDSYPDRHRDPPPMMLCPPSLW